MSKFKEILLGAAVGAIGSIIVFIFAVGGEWQKWKSIQKHVENHPAAGPGIPKNMVAFFLQSKCPEGWELQSNLDGRYVVGVAGSDIRVGETVGISLENEENRVTGKHSHNIVGVQNHTHTTSAAGNHSHKFDGARDYDSGAGDYGRAKPTGAERNTSASGNHEHTIGPSGAHSHAAEYSGTIEGTNAPYIQLLACRKL